MARLDVELQAAARRKGRAARASAAPIDGLAAAEVLLGARGYEPRLDADGTVLRMINCPFHALAERYPGLVCGMNLALLEGLMEDADGLRTSMDPRPGLCCVVVESL